MKPSKDMQAEGIIARCDRLKSERATWDTLWQRIADYVQPRKSQITTKKTEGVEGFTDDLYNLTAVRANQILASGQMDYLFTGRWFSFDPAPELEGDDEARRWYQRCTEVTMRELARSNWNLEIHEMLLDRGAFGSAVLLCEEGSKRPLAFHKFDVGTFALAEDHEGNVDTLVREFELTARQAKQKFGEEALGPILREACKSEKKQDQRFKFIHSIHPREDYDGTKVDGQNRPIASCYVSRDDRMCVKVDGYFETPFAASRFLKWGDSVYGYSPSIEALPTVRQVNFLEKNWDALTEIKAFPRVLIPEGMEGDVDLRAGGVTTFDPNASGAVPQEWGTIGDDRSLGERVKTKDEAIREAYHVDLFQMLQQIERQMTAFEVQQRLAEKVTAFSPTFYRLQTEVTNPLLLRVFSLLFRAGKYGQPPASAMVQSPDGQTQALAVPEVTLTSKLAMAIKAAENNAFIQMVNILGPVAQMDPSVMDNFDLDKASRGIAANLAVPTDWQRSEADRDAMREQRAQAAQQAQSVELAQGAATAAKDASAASPEVRQAVMGQ
jgi:hypothetical protein